MDSKAIALIIVFSALTIALNPIRIPTLFWPGQYFRLWEIPIITAFMLFAFRIGFSVAIINALGQLAFFMGPAGFIAAPWGVILMLTMFLGLYLAKKTSEHMFRGEKIASSAKIVAYFTIIVVAVRATIMPLVDYVVYRSLLPISTGRVFSEAYIIGIIPFSILFNIIVPVYSIPICYLLTQTVSKSLKLPNKFFLASG